MVNRISRAVQDYAAWVNGRKPTEGGFWVSDFYEVMELSKGDAFQMIKNSLEAGFIIGYRKAQRDFRRKKNNA